MVELNTSDTSMNKSTILFTKHVFLLKKHLTAFYFSFTFSGND